MRCRKWIAVGVLTCFVSTAWSQTPATGPATPPTTAPAQSADISKLPPEIRAALEEMRKTIDQQNKRIAELESKQGNDEKIRREEIIAVLKEMKITGDKKANDIRVYYKDGLKFDTNDGNFKLGINGRIFNDWAWINATEYGDKKKSEIRDGVEFRSIRLKFSGDIYKDYFYMVELEFANDSVLAKDVYMGMKNIPVVGNFRVGHFKEPFSLDDLTGDSSSTFMEYALPNALVPDRKMGMMANNAILDERMTWAVGMFRNSDVDGFKSGQDLSDKGYNVTGRLTGLPLYENNGKQLIHLGAAYSLRTPNDVGTVQYSARPEAHMAPTFIDSGPVDADRGNLFGGELAGVWDSFHAESEFVSSRINTKEDGNPTYNGFYAQAGYFLTGETRPYNKATGTFGRLRPLKNFRENGGLGAWEVATRYSVLDLDQDKYGSNRGELQDVTVGLNWYLNPNMRIMWNYIHAMPDTSLLSNAAEIFMMRFQVEF